MSNNRSPHILKIILYVFAAAILALGVITGVSLIASAANIHNVLMPFQFMGAEAITNLIAPYLIGLIRGLGIFVLIVSLIISVLLFAVGLLLGYVTTLERRLVVLETNISPVRNPE